MCSFRHSLLLLAIASCGSDHGDNSLPDGGLAANDATSCATPYLTWDNFGDGFMENWCRGCHSANLPDDMRQGSPTDVNFDTVDEVRNWSQGILDTATTATGMTITMPVAGGPLDSDRALLATWIQCGAP